MKIKHFTMQNVKGVNVFDYEFPLTGTTILGGRNNQGKSSVLHGAAYCFGGEAYRPSNYKKMDSDGEPYMCIETDEGITIERVGESADLYVTDATGKKRGQRLLDTFISKFALDVPKFLNGSEKERNAALLQTIGIGDQLDAIDEEEATEYEERRLIGQIKEQKIKAVKEMPFYPDVPEKEVSAATILAKLDEIHKENAKIDAAIAEASQNEAELANLVANGEELDRQYASIDADLATKKEQVKTQTARQMEALKAQIESIKQQMQQVTSDAETLVKDFESNAESRRTNMKKQMEANEAAIVAMSDKVEKAKVRKFVRIDDSALRKELDGLEEVNAKIRANAARAEKQKEADEQSAKYDEKTEKIEAIRRKRDTLLEGADLPYPGLSYQNKHIYLDGKAWDCINESKKYMVACAIVMRINPNCRFVFMDKLEQMDAETRKEFDQWVRDHDMQVIGTLVSSNADECSLVIKNGYIDGMEKSFIVPRRVRRRAKGAKEETVETVGNFKEEPIAATPTAKALEQTDFSIEREEAVSEDVAATVASASDAVARAKELLARRRAKILG